MKKLLPLFAAISCLLLGGQSASGRQIAFSLATKVLFRGKTTATPIPFSTATNLVYSQDFDSVGYGKMADLALPGWSVHMEDESEVLRAPVQASETVEGYEGGHLWLCTEGRELVYTLADGSVLPTAETSMKVRLIPSDTYPEGIDTDVHAAVFLMLNEPEDPTNDGLYGYTDTGWSKLDTTELGPLSLNDVLALKVTMDYSAKTVSYSGVVVTDDPYASLADTDYVFLGTLGMANPATASLANVLASVAFHGVGGIDDLVITTSGSFVTFANPQISSNGVDFVASSLLPGSAVPYGAGPSVKVDVAPQNGARDIRVSVEAVSVDASGAPLPGAEAVLVPMEGNPGAGGTFAAQLPALPAGRTGYRFIATYEGVATTQTTFPASGYYLYETDATLDDQREPDFATLLSHSTTQNYTYNTVHWRFVNVHVDRFLPNSIGFNAEAGSSIIASRQTFHGIGRIYFKAHKLIQSDRADVPHYLAVEISDDGTNWKTLNTVEIPYGLTETDDTQFCIEANTYDAKYVRFIRTTSENLSVCYLYLRDVVVTPPAANVELTMPSIIHPGYPSQHDDITIRADVVSAYEDYPAATFRPVLHWRRYTGAVPGAWRESTMSSSDDESFFCTLPAMEPGRVEYYVETHFSGASYDYAASDKYDADRPLRFFYAYDDTLLDHDPKDFKEGSSPTFLFAAEESPKEFSTETQQRALYAPGSVEGDSATPYLWFKVRAFASRHQELRFVYTNALEILGNGAAAPVHTNALQLVGDETWLTTIPVNTNVHFFGHILGVAPYEGAATMAYGAVPTRWGDPDQATVVPPFAGVAAIDAATPFEADVGMETGDSSRLMVRLDTRTGAYQIRQAAFQDFNEWPADPTYFEDSMGLHETPTYEEGFDDSALFPTTEMDRRSMSFQTDNAGGNAIAKATADTELATYYTSCGWRLRNGWILRERTPEDPYNYHDNNPNIAAMLTPQYGYLENTSSDSALAEGLDTISFRCRSSFGGDGHLPYYKEGFGWQNYTLTVLNARVTQMSPGHPYIQVIAGYADEDNYVAMRLTQMRELDSNRVRHWVMQELIKVQNGVETILQSATAKNYAAPKGSVTSNRFDNVELTYAPWVLELAVTNGALMGKALLTSHRSLGTNVLYAAEALAGTASAEGGTISFDACDALVNFNNINVKGAGNPTNWPTLPGKWNLGGIQKGGSETRWNANASGVSNKMPPLQFSIGVCRAGDSAMLPGDATYETVYTANEWKAENGFGIPHDYVTVSRPIHYWGNAFVRIAAGVSDARLVVDDVVTTSWRGRALPENDPDNDDEWQAREAVVVERNGSRQLALTTSRADPNARQMVSTPAMTNGLGTISFNYEVTGGRIVFAVERNAVSGRYADDDAWVQLDERTIEAGSRGEVFLPVRLAISGKIRVRVLHEQSGEDATLYLDNLFAKGFPPDDGHSWTAYNALIVAPSRNAATDPLQFEEDLATQTAFLNNSAVAGIRPNSDMGEHLPFVQSPRMPNSIGEIGFWYRVWDPANPTPGRLTLWLADDPLAPDGEWRQIAADDLACITNGVYRYFSTEIPEGTNHVLRICCDTNGTQRVAIDNVVVMEPLRGSPAGNDHTLTSPVPVPFAWFDERYPALLAAYGGDYEAAANAVAANGVNGVWQCYLAGISPLDETARFRATITMVEGEPVVEPDPDLAKGTETPEREYILLGAKSLAPDATWDVVTNGTALDEAGYRFFKVKVRLK